MIYYIAGLSLTRIPALAAYKRAWRVFVGYAKRIRETSFTSHFKIGLLIYGVVNHTIYKQEYFGFAEDTRLGRVCETQISKNTQAYFGDRRMLRTGFVFDELLRTPTYSTKFHTQAYRSGHNEAVLKICRSSGSKSAEIPWFHWLFRDS